MTIVSNFNVLSIIAQGQGVFLPLGKREKLPVEHTVDRRFSARMNCSAATRVPTYPSRGSEEGTIRLPTIEKLLNAHGQRAQGFPPKLDAHSSATGASSNGMAPASQPTGNVRFSGADASAEHSVERSASTCSTLSAQEKWFVSRVVSHFEDDDDYHNIARCARDPTFPEAALPFSRAVGGNCRVRHCHPVVVVRRHSPIPFTLSPFVPRFHQALSSRVTPGLLLGRLVRFHRAEQSHPFPLTPPPPGRHMLLMHSPKWVAGGRSSCAWQIRQ